jgi:hypothetical protein
MLVGGLVGAQTNERAYESIQFRVVTPGARAVGMGKTFVGVADDATAAASNPAGLSNLLDPELSAELSRATLRTHRMIGVDPFRALTFGESVYYPSFASVVLPLPGRKLQNFTIAAFYNSLQRYSEKFAIPVRDEHGNRIPQGGYYGKMDISAETFGLGGAALVSSKLSLGGAVTIQRSRRRGPPGQFSKRHRDSGQRESSDVAGRCTVQAVGPAEHWWCLLQGYDEPSHDYH